MLFRRIPDKDKQLLSAYKDIDVGCAPIFALNPALAVHLHRDPIDFCAGINGLCAIAEHVLKLDPFAPACFAFCNKRRDRIKLLFLAAASGFA